MEFIINNSYLCKIKNLCLDVKGVLCCLIDVKFVRNSTHKSKDLKAWRYGQTGRKDEEKMIRLSRYLILLYIAQAFCLAAVAQSSRQGTYKRTVPVKMLVYQNLDNDSVLKVFEVRFAQLDSLISNTWRFSDNLLETGTYGIQPETDSLFDAKERSERLAFISRNGLEVTGQIYQRLDNTFGFDDDDQYSQYSTKFQGEIGWNFFNSGFFQRKSELKVISLDNKLKKLQQNKSRSTLYWNDVNDRIGQKYDFLIATVLCQQLQDIDVLNLAYQYLLERDRVANDKLFDVVNEKMRVEYELSRICPPDSVKNAPLILLRPTVIEVDSVRLFAAIEGRNTDIQIAKAREDMLDAKKNLTNYAQSMRLTPFLRASHYLHRDFSSSTNIDLGVRFTIPLYDDASAKRKAMMTEKQIAALDRLTLGDGIRQQCARQITQIGQLNRAIVTENFHMQQIKKMIELRKKAYEAATGAYNHVQRMEEYNEYLKSIERMYKLMQMREQCIIDINKTADCPDFASMLNEKDI